MFPQLVPEMLQEYSELTRRALNRYLPAREPQRYLYSLIADYPRRGGKGLRPSLCLATAHAFGARRNEALPAAVSIELLHNGTLIHDDIEDESLERRGRPTLHIQHGIPLALNAGDSLILLSLQPLLESHTRFGSRLTFRFLTETERAARELSEGQALELGWRRDNAAGLRDEHYLNMVLKKTCWHGMVLSTFLGGLIGTGDPHLPLAPFLRFGFFLGTAFQIRDDLLNLVGDERYGKELNGDILEGKRSLPMIRLLQEAAPPERERLLAFLAQPRAERSEADVLWIRRLMDRYGCIEHAQGIACGLAGAAKHEFELLYGPLPDSRDKRFIEELVTWMLLRVS